MRSGNLAFMSAAIKMQIAGAGRTVLPRAQIQPLQPVGEYAIGSGARCSEQVVPDVHPIPWIVEEEALAMRRFRPEKEMMAHDDAHECLQEA